MSAETFFPCAGFGWSYCVAAAALAFTAAGIDLRYYRIPRVLSLGLLAAGIAFSLVRGAMVGADGQEAWVCGANGAFVGLLDAFLFSAAGVVVGFGLFFVMWIAGACGGGDVKLFAAVAAWTGPLWAVFLLITTIFIVVAMALVKLLWSGATRGASATAKDFSSRMRQSQGGGKRQTATELAQSRQGGARLLSFSLPIAIALVLTFGWLFRKPLHLEFEAQAKGPWLARMENT
jgi:prepilin peptidase CpaA